MQRRQGPAAKKKPAGKRVHKEHKSIFEMPTVVDPQRVWRAKRRAEITREYRESIRDIYHETDHLRNVNESSQFIVSLERTGSAAGMVSGRNSAMSTARAESRQKILDWQQSSPRNHDHIPKPPSPRSPVPDQAEDAPKEEAPKEETPNEEAPVEEAPAEEEKKNVDLDGTEAAA